ncbi:diguanylate cyclase [Sphingosinicella sp. LHD-64]|uniref:diguanylate cyclase domain-containing protein n=1 Tax=Sphingosinicella sp. LHD-64 TaxID=3072139 RepID=UPI00280EE788|nr:diguanylate cyclase [Sphingosinicella sp. LHD-64]MDQ8756381.1 diguanylate cyclase [Sphingosinicella sp. LHD-64]
MSAPAPRPTIRDALARVHARVTLFAVTLSAFAMLLVGYLAARDYAQKEVRLTAQAAAYTAEAALVFEDRIALAEALAPVVRTGDVELLVVRTTDGREMYAWRSEANGLHFPGERIVRGLAMLAPAVAPVTYQGQRIGEVELRGSGAGLAHLLLRGLAGMLACLLIIAVVGRALSRRLQRTVADPLAAIARVAHEVRAERAFERRVPGAEIAEIDSLGDDFNALLAELEAWRSHVESEHETLAYRATHDALTGLPNRAFFENQIARALEEAETAEATVGLIYVDGDGFKAVNDRHGHAAGDAVLVEMAMRIRACAGAADVVARVGGDEFVVLLVGDDAAARSGPMAAEIAGTSQRPFTLPDGSEVRPALSAGIALYPEHGRDAAALLRKADRAMYAEKKRRVRAADGAE